MRLPCSDFFRLCARLTPPVVFLLLLARSAQAIGTSPIAPGVAPSPVPADSSSWAVRLYDVELFELPGLRSFGASVTTAVGGLCAGARVSRLTSPVGSETELAATLGSVRGTSGHLAVVLAHETVVFGTAASSLTSAGIDARARVSQGVVLFARVERVRIAGVAHPGADVVVGVEVGASRGISVAATVRLDRRYGSTLGLSLRVRPVAALVMRAGIDDTGGAAFCDMTVGAGMLAATAAVWVHEVLGMSRGVSLLWKG